MAKGLQLTAVTAVFFICDVSSWDELIVKFRMVFRKTPRVQMIAG